MLIQSEAESPRRWQPYVKDLNIMLDDEAKVVISSIPQAKAIFLIGSTASGYATAHSDHDFVAIVPGYRVYGRCLQDHPRIEVLLVGEDLLTHFLTAQPTDFVDAEWLLPTCMITTGTLIIDRERCGATLQEQFQQYISAEPFRHYLHALRYRADRCLEKAEHLKQTDQPAALLTASYATWDYVRVLLANRNVFFRGPAHLSREIQHEQPELFALILASALQAPTQLTATRTLAALAHKELL